MLDDLRKTSGDDELDDFGFDDDDSFEQEVVNTGRSGKLFGLRPVERMVLSIMFFLLTLVFGILVLIATGRIAL
jgi:hypothetical protein